MTDDVKEDRILQLILEAESVIKKVLPEREGA